MVNEPTNAREVALKRLKARRDFATHVVSYVVFNTAAVLIWYLTGHGYFWPGWLLALWGAGIVMHAWDVWGRRPITEEDIRRELDRRGGSVA
ncbi:MAG TPA: 2TM domain-containing protein [Candidatus Dormibacteraeota bacterium]|nr:2TM domain-containing protein [Candidatus Dormibacteraeota bacterium]